MNLNVEAHAIMNRTRWLYENWSGIHDDPVGAVAAVVSKLFGSLNFISLFDRIQESFRELLIVSKQEARP